MIAGLCSTINSKSWQCLWYSVYLIHTITTALPCIAYVRFIMWVRSNSSRRCGEHDVSGAFQTGSQFPAAVGSGLLDFQLSSLSYCSPYLLGIQKCGKKPKQNKTKTKTNKQKKGTAMSKAIVCQEYKKQ